MHAGVSDHAGPAEARADAPARMAFRYSNNVGTRDYRPVAAQWPAYTLPCRRFAGTLAGADARLGAGVDRYSFTVMDWLISGFGVMTDCHATRAAMRAPRRAFPRRRVLWTNWKKPR